MQAANLGKGVAFVLNFPGIEAFNLMMPSILPRRAGGAGAEAVIYFNLEIPRSAAIWQGAGHHRPGSNG